jgi:uncharacterized coiled-coil protein SlyX
MLQGFRVEISLDARAAGLKFFMADQNTDERMAKIEAHLAHLEHLVDQLNQIVVEQSETLRRFQTQQQRMSASLEGIELERIKSTNPKPPHYQ